MQREMHPGLETENLLERFSFTESAKKQNFRYAMI